MLNKQITWTTKVQISPCSCAVRSAPLLFAAYTVCYVYLLYPKFKSLASFCSRSGWSESYLLKNLRSHIFAWCGSFYGLLTQQSEIDEIKVSEKKKLSYFINLKAHILNYKKMINNTLFIRFPALGKLHRYAWYMTYMNHSREGKFKHELILTCITKLKKKMLKEIHVHVYTMPALMVYMGPVKRKCVFECLRPIKIQTSLLSYRD